VSEAVAIIEAAELSAGHDGRAEIVLLVRYPNGAAARVRLDEEAAAQALDAAGIAQLDDLIGKAWDILAPHTDSRGG
jgi:predicted Fe-Mo cluster-binding NifX family protein